MTKEVKKKKFSMNQPVVFRHGERRLVGKVSFIRPIGKQYLYHVQCEDGKEYEDLQVDIAMNQCIDTYLTKLFYQKYEINGTFIPKIEDVVPYTPTVDSTEEEEFDDYSDSRPFADPDEILFHDDELDDNY